MLYIRIHPETDEKQSCHIRKVSEAASDPLSKHHEHMELQKLRNSSCGPIQPGLAAISV